MKTLIALLALIALFALTSCISDPETEQEKLESIFEQFTTISNDTILEVADKHLDIDFKWYVGDELHTAYAAWDGIETSTFWYTVANQVVQTIDTAEWMIAPDLAVVKANGTFTKYTGQVWDHLLTGVFEKKDGKWYLVHMHSSFMP